MRKEMRELWQALNDPAYGTWKSSWADFKKNISDCFWCFRNFLKHLMEQYRKREQEKRDSIELDPRRYLFEEQRDELADYLKTIVYDPCVCNYDNLGNSLSGKNESGSLFGISFDYSIFAQRYKDLGVAEKKKIIKTKVAEFYKKMVYTEDINGQKIPCNVPRNHIAFLYYDEKGTVRKFTIVIALNNKGVRLVNKLNQKRLKK